MFDDVFFIEFVVVGDYLIVGVGEFFLEKVILWFEDDVLDWFESIWEDVKVMGIEWVFIVSYINFFKFIELVELIVGFDFVWEVMC